MSDHVVQSGHDSDGMAKESLHLYQSVWMARHKSSKPESQGLRCPYREEGDIKQLRPEMSPPSISKSAERMRESSESGTINTMNESLKLGSENVGKEGLESQSFPKSNLTQQRHTVKAPMNVATVHGVVSKMRTSSGGGHFQHEGSQGNLEQQENSRFEALQNKSLAVSTSFQHDVGSSSRIVPHRYNSENSPAAHFFKWQQELNQPSHLMSSKGHWETTKFRNYSTSLVHEMKIKNPLDFGRRGTSSSRQNNKPLLQHVPSARNNQPPGFGGKHCQDMQNHYDTRSIPSWRNPSDATKSETSFHDFLSVVKIPGSLPDVGTRAMDSMEELSVGPSKFSQMTHHFMITKKTGVNLSERGKMFRDSTFSTRIKGKMLNQLLSLSPGLGFHAQHGVKLQPLGSSTDGEGLENFGDVKTSTVCLKNESSAETEIMDVDAFQKDHFSSMHTDGLISSPTHEIDKGGQVSSTLEAALAPSTEETRGRLLNTEIPDINEEPPAVPTVGCPVNNRETSTSRTQSLDADHLLSHAELPSNAKSRAFPHGHLELEPSIRWVKRLKLSDPGTSAHGTKISKMEEASYKTANNFFNNIMRCSMNSSGPTTGKCPGTEPMAVGQPAVFSRNVEPSSAASVKKNQDVTLSDPWIRRWCHLRDSSPTKNHEALVVCEPQSSNAASKTFQKKQFPSIAAMALMGKALNCFQPCEFRKRGSYIVWNA